MRLSILLPLSAAFLGLLNFSSCSSSHESWHSELAHGWSDSSYRLSQQESTRFKTESRRAQKNGNREVCGAILKRPNGALNLCFADNESRQPHSFQLSSKSVRRMEQIARATNSLMIGSFHSHPSSDATPGSADLVHAGVHSLMLIHSIPTDRIRLWKVVLRDGEKKAREVQLQVIGQRSRGPSPLPPSRLRIKKNDGGNYDVRTR